MCGIAGRVCIEGRDHSESVADMVRALRHRGPDFQSVVRVDRLATLGHARLSILDLSRLANQPMTDPMGRYTLVYNGEVYNFKELRHELQAAGFAFRSTSDTEVVLAAFAHWGTGCFARFDGMFALAIWDRNQAELTLGRDRFGEKPLYYALTSTGVAFASEVTALWADSELRGRRRVSVEGLNEVLALGYTLGPGSFYQGIMKLPPATHAQWRPEGFRPPLRYWDYAKCFERKRSVGLDDGARELRELLDVAVSSRLIADVPVGSFLSGGLDSSGVTAFATRHLAYPMHTFSAGFDVASYDESEDARRTALHVGSIHHELELRARACDLQLLDEAIARYDEPFSDTSLVCMVAVARLASKHVKVVLSGDAADEIFAGYTTYQADRLKSALDVVPTILRRLGAKLVVANVKPGRSKVGTRFKIRQFSKGLARDWRYAHYAWRELHDEDERIRIFGPQRAEEVRDTHPFRKFQRFYEEVADLEPFDQHLYVDAKTWLVDDILVKVDRATMAASIESRAPYLANAVVEYAASLPAALKLRQGRGKVILRKALQPLLPVETLNKKKAGFNAPVGVWMGRAEEGEFTRFNRYVLKKKGVLVDGNGGIAIDDVPRNS